MCRLSKKSISRIAIALYLTLVGTWNFYLKYNIPPLLAQINDERASTDEIPFPGVIICNMNKVKKSVFFSLLRKDELRKFFINDTCYDVNQTDYVSEETRKKASKWNNYYNFQQLASQDCSEMIYYCRWAGKVVDCSKLFKPVFTDMGLCCVFNIAHLVIDSGKGRPTVDWSLDKYVNWTPEYKFEKSDPHSAIPRRGIPGFMNGLLLALDVNFDEYHCSKNNNVGFLVLLHNPVEIPELAKFNASIHPGTEIHMNIMPSLVEPSDIIAKKDVDYRRCYFLDERKLRFYRVYTINNCEHECLANYTIEFCGCLPKHIPVDFNINICGKTEEKCVSQMHDKSRCNCYPGCYAFGYDAVATILPLTSGFTVKKSIKNNGIRHISFDDVAILHLYYGNDTYEKCTLVENPTYTLLHVLFNASYVDYVIMIVLAIITFTPR